ncbi:sialate O-acetylesterase [Cohnella nanjingensis]|uniref:Sialate O-acetylesterase domain-containing protein n=1 Tax=Cohnella nanjingensis TaxID=1387779 RepID=A0A7X0RPR2_9BACL|nr:sialate O-acetylesterase [Cohnella nanjingensis]MBB6671203.1 hypothetical protein [Cohnella nanjingensis]
MASIAKASGLFIEEGPASWTILQQREGFAELALRGSWHAEGEFDPERAQAYVRVMREEDGEAVLPWQSGEMADDRRWSIRLAVPAGGLYRVETCLRIRKDDPAMEWPVRGDMIHHLGVGDLWLIAGQSNAAGYGRGPHDDNPELGVHLFRLNGRWDMATHPLNDPTDTRFPPNREWSNPGHSPFLAFAKRLKRELGYPIGLVPAALGGSHLRSWNLEETGELYRNLLDIVRHAGGGVKGMAWYQGCSDANVPESGESETYPDRFKRFVGQLREDLDDAELPVLTVQLNRLIGWETSDALDRCWGRVREAQRQAAERIPGVHVVPSLDCAVCDNIHNGPEGNVKLGGRLAKVALGAVYGRGPLHRAPRAVQAEYDCDPETGESRIVLRFANVAGHLLAHTTENVFTVEDASGRAEVRAWQVAGPREIALKLSRALAGEAVVHGAFETNPAYYVPFDDATRWPMLAFYGLRVELGNPSS